MVEKRVKKSKMAVVKSKHRWLWRETSKIIFVHGKSDFWISVDGVVDDRQGHPPYPTGVVGGGRGPPVDCKSLEPCALNAQSLLCGAVRCGALRRCGDVWRHQPFHRHCHCHHHHSSSYGRGGPLPPPTTHSLSCQIKNIDGSGEQPHFFDLGRIICILKVKIKSYNEEYIYFNYYQFFGG